ncbi:hypothetical protein EDEG_03912 [Edhazardia aedis USNM 41457]|uniref:Uncharacterized protein n=1 Tax=Edhazardia aedis (strain USNM 41457) TaxID=1003232 RepID=J9DJF5_EDHAE|nr:hypothetical protein EDEG_03912 [Edhazardia aedis USNM 41457]|eukprot:EJW01507.1 hypothetical protein EDEG_03912 [Edhazardia aedis USNM 41457]
MIDFNDMILTTKIAKDAEKLFSESFHKLRNVEITQELEKSVNEHYEKAKIKNDDAYLYLQKSTKEKKADAKKELSKITDEFLFAFMAKKIVFARPRVFFDILTPISEYWNLFFGFRDYDEKFQAHLF